MTKNRSLLGRAVELGKYVKAIKKRELLRVAVYITERCNSRCRICGVWKRKDPQDMPMGIFRRVLDGAGQRTHLAILGGEPLLHPNIEKMLRMLKSRGCDYNLETNGILAERLFELTKRYKIPEIQLSCDGRKDTYRKIRGVDSYDNIAWLIERLPQITKVRVNYVICPWNTREDLLAVKELCDEFGVELDVEVYDVFEYLDTPKIETDGIYKADDVQPFPRSLLLRLYDKWSKGSLRLPCYSVKWSCVVVPDGEVYLCTHKMVSLGNLREGTLAAIWQSDKARALQNKYMECNDCWSGCYRNVDIALAVIDPRYTARVLC